MSKNKYILLLLTLICFSCQEDKGRPIIKEDIMAEIFADYYIKQATISQFETKDTEVRFLYYAESLDRFGFNEADFDSSMVWYTKNLDVLSKVYEQTLAILTLKKDSLNTLLQEEVAKAAEKRDQANKQNEAQ